MISANMTAYSTAVGPSSSFTKATALLANRPNMASLQVLRRPAGRPVSVAHRTAGCSARGEPRFQAIRKHFFSPGAVTATGAAVVINRASVARRPVHTRTVERCRGVSNHRCDDSHTK